MSTTGTGKPEGWLIPYLPGALVVMPPKETQTRIGRLRRRYDPTSAQLIPAHVTVTQPFRNQPERRELGLIQKILRRFRPFRVQYGPLKTFLPYPCIWYEIQPAERLLGIRRELHATGLFNTDLPHTRDFTPHMSITDGSPGPKETERIYHRIKARVGQGSFVVTTLTYTRPDWQMRFKAIEHLSLGIPGAEQDQVGRARHTP